jgi:hypothetical protein
LLYILNYQMTFLFSGLVLITYNVVVYGLLRGLSN